MQGLAHPLPSLSLGFFFGGKRAITSEEFVYLTELPGGSKCWCEGACPANREAPRGTELLLETGPCDMAQGLETAIPIWKIESILRLEFWFMILCISCQKWAQPKVPLTTRCWGGFTVKTLFIRQLAVKSRIVLRYSHYPESPAVLLPRALAKPAPLRTTVKLSQGHEWILFSLPSCPANQRTQRSKWEARGTPEWLIYSLFILPPLIVSSPTPTRRPIWWWVRLYREKPKAVSFQPSKNHLGIVS